MAGEGYYNKTLNVYELSFLNNNYVHVYLRILTTRKGKLNTY